MVLESYENLKKRAEKELEKINKSKMIQIQVGSATAV